MVIYYCSQFLCVDSRGQIFFCEKRYRLHGMNLIVLHCNCACGIVEGCPRQISQLSILATNTNWTEMQHISILETMKLDRDGVDFVGKLNILFPVQ